MLELGDRHGCAVMNYNTYDGVFCWGDNKYGQLARPIGESGDIRGIFPFGGD
jgi:hypothetical protein